MSEDLCGQGVYETYYDGTEGVKQQITKRLGTVRAIGFDPQANQFALLIAAEDGTLITKAASTVHLKRLLKAP